MSLVSLTVLLEYLPSLVMCASWGPSKAFVPYGVHFLTKNDDDSVCTVRLLVFVSFKTVRIAVAAEVAAPKG